MIRVIKILIIPLIIIIGIVVAVLVNKGKEEVKTEEENTSYYAELGLRTKQNISEKIKEEKENDGLTFQNANIIYSNGVTTFSVTIINKNNEDYEAKKANLIFVDEEGNRIDNIEIEIPVIASKEVKTVNSNTDRESLLEAYDYYIE